MFKKFLFSLVVVLFATSFYGCTNSATSSGSSLSNSETPMLDTLTDINLGSPLSLSGEYEVTSGLDGAKVILQVADDKRIYVTFMTNKGEKISLARYLDATSNISLIQEAFNINFLGDVLNDKELELTFFASRYPEIREIFDGRSDIVLTLKKLRDVSANVANLPSVAGVPVYSMYITNPSLAQDKMNIDYRSSDPEKVSVSIYPPIATKAGNYTLVSSDTSKLTVDSNGVLTPKVVSGTAKLKLSLTDIDGSAKSHEVTVNIIDNRILPTAMGLNHSKKTLVPNKGINVFILKPEFEPFETTEESVSYSVPDESVVKVSQDGTVVAVNNGTATVTVTSLDNDTLTATCVVTVSTARSDVYPTGVTFSETSVTKDMSEVGLYIDAAIAPADVTNDTILYWSSDRSVATVDSDGAVKFKKTGTVTIYGVPEANINNVAPATLTIDITNNSYNPLNPEKYMVSPAYIEATTQNARTVTLKNIVLPDTASGSLTYQYSSDNEGVATVDSNGTITTIKTAGTAIITATAYLNGDEFATSQAKVSVISGIAIGTSGACSNGIANTGVTVDLTQKYAMIIPSGGNVAPKLGDITIPFATYTHNQTTVYDRSVTLSIASNSGVIELDTSTGTVKLLKAGTATVKVTTVAKKPLTGNNCTGAGSSTQNTTLSITVTDNSYNRVASVEFAGDKNIVIDPHETSTIALQYDVIGENTLKAPDNANVTFTSSDTKVATVSNLGVVEFVQPFSYKDVTITVTTVENNKKDFLNIRLLAPTDTEVVPDSILVKPPYYSTKVNPINKKTTPSTTLHYEVSPADVTYRKVLFSSTNENIASVDEHSGHVTFKDFGDVTITIRSEYDPSVYVEVPFSIAPNVEKFFFKYDNVSAPRNSTFEGYIGTKGNTLYIMPANALTGLEATYTSDDPSIASVYPDNGTVITYDKSGEVTITAVSNDFPNISASYKLTVFTPLSKSDMNTWKGSYKVTYIFTSPMPPTSRPASIATNCYRVDYKNSTDLNRPDYLLSPYVAGTYGKAPRGYACDDPSATGTGANGTMGYMTGVGSIDIVDGNFKIVTKQNMKGHGGLSVIMGIDSTYAYSAYYPQPVTAYNSELGRLEGTEAGSNGGSSSKEPFWFDIDPDDLSSSTLRHYISAYKNAPIVGAVNSPTHLRLTKISDDVVTPVNKNEINDGNNTSDMNDCLKVNGKYFWHFIKGESGNDNPYRDIIRGDLPINNGAHHGAFASETVCK